MFKNLADGSQYKHFTHQKYNISSLLVFFLIFAYYLISWPIVFTDADLWYHLSGGRYFWQNGTIAKDAFFSYINPQNSWYNYYWMFQAVIYKFFQWTGYYGLIALRCLLYFLTALFICLFFNRQNEKRNEMLVGIFLFVTCTIVILPRETAVRPHLFSYFFIVIFLYILEFKRDKIWILPLLGILWSNLHGIEYPVMILIVFAYLAENFWRQFRKIKIGVETGKKENWILISVFYTIFITPGFIELVQTPFSVSFQNAAYQHLYVIELLPIPFRNFFILAPVSIKGLINSLQNLIVILSTTILLISLWKKKLRISHAILFLCSLMLLAKHNRFIYEFTLLSVPLLYNGVHPIAERIRLPRRVINFALPVVVILLPLIVFHGVFSNRPAYPFSQSNLPTGIVRFLNQNAAGGKILNEANTGGYLPWALNEKFKIYMDMQMTIFSDNDFAEAQNALFDVNTFKSFIKKYDPSYISVSVNRSHFKKIVANEPQFVPIFFDYAEALFVNKNHYSDLAEQYELKAIDPFTYWQVIYANEPPENLIKIYNEALRMLEQDPDNYRANHILSSIAIVHKKYDRAHIHADVIIRNHPDLSHGYALKGDAFFWMGQYEEAASLYKKALDMGRISKAENVYWNLHASYNNMKEYKKAYKVLSKYVNPFNPHSDYKEICQLGISAASVGKIREAVKFLKIAKLKVPPTDAEYVQKIGKNLAELENTIH
jgi:tetratricopeptide (TPR) repeat protein